ncbi:hypothetical protein Tco_0412275 [Tanacetum coccineum]
MNNLETLLNAETLHEMDSNPLLNREKRRHEQELKMTLKKLSERQLQIQQCKVQEVQSSVTSLGDETSSGIVSDEEIDKQELESTFSVSWQRFRTSYLQNQVLLIRHWNRKVDSTLDGQVDSEHAERRQIRNKQGLEISLPVLYLKDYYIQHTLDTRKSYFWGIQFLGVSRKLDVKNKSATAMFFRRRAELRGVICKLCSSNVDEDTT